MKMIALLMGLLVVLHPLWLAAAQVNAENRYDSEDETKMVVTATITEKTIEAAPGSVEVLSAQEIRETGAQTVAEALEWAVGLVVSSETGRAKVPSIRGSGNRHTLVLVDGRRIVSGYKDFIDTDQIPVTMVERIEIVRGPNSALYGSDAIGGVVNIITKKTPTKTEAGLMARYGAQEGGNGAAFNGSAYAGTRQGRFGVLLSGGYRDKDGWDEDGILPDDGDDKHLGSAAGRFSLDLGDHHGLSAGFEYSDAEQNGNRFYQNLEREREAQDRRLNYYLQYDARPESGRHFMARAYRSEHENEIGFLPDAEVTAEEEAEHYLNQVETRFSLPLFQRHILFMGAEYRTEGREDSRGSEDDMENTSLFVQDEYQITDPVYLVMGLRYDGHSEFGDWLTPRVSLIYRLHEHFRFKAAYGKGFRSPTLSELFVTSYRQRGRVVYEPNPDLEPEKADTYECGFEGESGRLRGKVTAFRNEVKDLIEAVFIRSVGSGNSATRYYTYQNITEARIQGLEVETGIALPLNLNLSGSLTWLDTENRQTGEELEGQPELKAILKLGYHFAELGIRADIHMNHTGRRYYASGDRDPFTTVGCYFSKDLGDHFSLFAGIDNVFDEEDVTDGVSYLEPRFYYTGFRIGY